MILTSINSKEEKVRSQTEKAADTVALSAENLNQVAGGYVKDHNECDTTYADSEWCWISDNCAVAVRYYDDSTKGNQYVEGDCANNMFGDRVEEMFMTADEGYNPTQGEFQMWCKGLDD